MSDPGPTPVRYSDDVEVIQPDEETEIQETISTMLHTMEQGFEQHRHATSATHAKTHGVLTGRLRVYDDLPAPLAQGLFARPASYDVVLRYSQGAFRHGDHVARLSLVPATDAQQAEGQRTVSRGDPPGVLRAYEVLGDRRHEVNARAEHNPRSLAEVPD